MMSALPKRYQSQLEKQLGSSVAVSTCHVDELEQAIKRRGATIAVVGAADDSLEIAERLSHASEGVKVFLVHYQDKLASKVPVNGFAGVFDVRIEQQKLAEMIRQEALQPFVPIQQTSSRSQQRQILEHFISINERLSRPALAYELMLDGFLQLADSGSGALILAHDVNRGAFRIAASHDFDFDQPQELVLPADTVSQMMTGDVLFVPDGFAGLSSRGWLLGSEFCVGVPLVAGKQLYGCLLAQTNEASELLADYGLMATHLVECMLRQELAAERENLIAAARKTASASWMLVDGSGRIVHREGTKFDGGKGSSRIQRGRLSHATNEALAGRAGSIASGDMSIAYEGLSAYGRDYAVVRMAQSSKLAVGGGSSGSTPEAMRMIMDVFADLPDKIEVVENLLSTEPSRYLAPTLEIKLLQSWGLKIISVDGQDDPKVSPALALLMLSFERRLSKNLGLSIAQFNGRHSLTFEVEESSLDQSFAHIATDPLVETVLRVTGLARMDPLWLFGTFGGRLEWSHYMA